MVMANQMTAGVGVESCTKGFATDVNDVSRMFPVSVSVKIKSCDVSHMILWVRGGKISIEKVEI